MVGTAGLAVVLATTHGSKPDLGVQLVPETIDRTPAPAAPTSTPTVHYTAPTDSPAAHHARYERAAMRSGRCYTPTLAEVDAVATNLRTSGATIVRGEARAARSDGFVFLAARVRGVPGDDPANGGEVIDEVAYTAGSPLRLQVVTGQDISAPQAPDYDQLATGAKRAMTCANTLAVASEPGN